MSGSGNESCLSQLEDAYELAGISHGWFSDEAMAQLWFLLTARNEASRRAGSAYLERVELGADFEPNDPDPHLVRGESTRLVLNPHPDDQDQRRICISWWDCILASFSPPDSEGVAASPVGKLGLGWYRLATVGNSPILSFFDNLLDLGSRRHFVLLLRETLFHAVASDFAVLRLEPSEFESLRAVFVRAEQLAQESVRDLGDD